ncbi:unnamed protein product [Lupinus luteus]|uniref:Glycosyltransferase n=1 Tax=Lupinus luteus TaxID=3873 RepID=A0AAV1WHW6_LUPLU
MESQSQKLNVIFLPYLLPGHNNPMVDTARLFAKHGVNVTIITTQDNAFKFQKHIDSDYNSGYSIRIHVLQLPSAQVSFHDEVENIKSGVSSQMLCKIGDEMLIPQDQVEQLLPQLHPDCLVTDQFYPWTVESAAKLGIPRLYFYSTSYFSTCAFRCIQKHKPHESLDSDTNKFSIPGLPHNIEMTTAQIEDRLKTKNMITDYLNAVCEAIIESEVRSYGTLCNSFHELESDYEQLYRCIRGVKSWSIGPVSTSVNKDDKERAKRDQKDGAIAEEPELLNWLDSKQNESVLYVSFGSLTKLPQSQLLEIALGLENSGHNFIWVVRNMNEDDDRDSLPQGFLQRMKESNKGYIIWNWAPQVLILNHPAVGGVVTHCGWNTILESSSAGLPMITWPMFAEQFYNEKLIVDVLKVGVSIGVKGNQFWSKSSDNEVVRKEDIADTVKLLMGSGEESKEMRIRARKVGDAAKRTIEEGGSSYNNLKQLIDELKSLKISKLLSKTKELRISSLGDVGNEGLNE